MVIEKSLKKTHEDVFFPRYVGKSFFNWGKTKTTDSVRSKFDVRLKEFDQLKNEFISAITHELRTPLTSVRALAEIIYHTPKLEPLKNQEFAGIIIEESERLSQLINNILELKNIKNRQVEWEKDRIDFRKILKSILNTIDQTMNRKNIELILELYPFPVFVLGDQDYLKQAMLNVVGNAIKFCDSNNGRIKIGMEVCEKEEDGTRLLKVCVKDNGIGIGKGDQELIFLEFRQVVSHSKGRPRGVGLGLTLAKKIIDSHGGKIWVSSELGKGAAFFITLPLIE